MPNMNTQSSYSKKFQKKVKGHGQGHTFKILLSLERRCQKEHNYQIWKPYLLGSKSYG